MGMAVAEPHTGSRGYTTSPGPAGPRAWPNAGRAPHEAAGPALALVDVSLDPSEPVPVTVTGEVGRHDRGTPRTLAEGREVRVLVASGR